MKSRKKIILGLICSGIILVILLAGLWPMDFRPENRVYPAGRGADFTGRSHAYTGISGDGKGLFDTGSISVELSIEPAKEPDDSVANILAFRNSSGQEVLTIAQWRSHFLVRDFRTWFSGGPKKEVALRGALVKGRQAFITVSIGPRGTVIYNEGRQAVSFPEFRLAREGGAAAALMVGNSPGGDNPWNGRISVLSIYKRALTKEEVWAHYGLVKGGTPGLLKDGAAVLYLFGGMRGGRVENAASPGVYDLNVPAVFSALNKRVLYASKRDLKLRSHYIKDILVNITGFVPFGFFFAALMAGLEKPAFRTLAAVILLGFLVSLSIELLQVFLPERTSSSIDLVMNTLGTAMGALAYGLKWMAFRDGADASGRGGN